ncbi:MAG: hypothetical protein JWO66_2395 [Candidatus Eremiobacteraeota bacterium]|nr:hypothetical protein [Candidatus Eremiobacteraeota bacterium]
MARFLAFFKRRTSLRSSVIAAVVFAGLAVVSLNAQGLWHQRSAEVHTIQRETVNLAHSLAQQANGSFQTVDENLLDLRERVETEGTGEQQLRRLRPVLAERIAGVPLLHNLFIVDEHANGLINALRIKNVNYADRKWFIFHRTHADRGMHIGATVRSRTDRSWIITVTRRLNHKDGSFAGVALATVAVSSFQGLYDSVNLGTSGIIDLTLADGAILVRKPYDAASVGRSLAKAPWYVQDLPHHPVGTNANRSIIDGVGRYYAYHRVDRYPLIVVVGIGQFEALTNWRWQALFSSIQVASVLLVLLFLGKYLTVQIGQREAAETELAALAMIDDLTRLGNRRRFDEWMDREWRRAIRSRTSLTCLMIDVDCFKSYNDSRGHQAGDGVLQVIAGQIAMSIRRPCDLAARYGGDEFVVLLSDTDAFGGQQIAEKIRTGVYATAIDQAGNPHNVVTVSIGVASSRPNLGAESGDLLKAADAALYEAKRDGRNRTVVGDPVVTTFGGEVPPGVPSLWRS